MADFVKVATTSEIAPGSGKTVDVEDKQIALFNVDGAFYAVDNTCVHQGGPLGEGMLEGKEVSCPWHGWVYDVTSGQSTSHEGCEVAKYEVKLEGDAVLIGI